MLVSMRVQLSVYLANFYYYRTSLVKNPWVYGLNKSRVYIYMSKNAKRMDIAIREMAGVKWRGA